MAVEREFDIEIPDAAVGTLRRVGDLHALIVATLAKRSASISPEVIWDKLRSLVADYVGLPPESITPDDDFIEDLRAG